tara:strand:- start:406 stop:939 length:534 start_codon:yes stop_codon:yes gene_type:complete
MIRFLDFFLSILFLIFLSPLFILILILNYLLNKKIFYNSYRIGLNGKKFKLIKFITINNEEFLKLGIFLRRTSLDELPQLINIVKGEMSLVGPRPYPIENFKNIRIDNFNLRHSIKPGLTGLAQIEFKGHKRSIEEKILIDLKMIDEFNILLYFKIIFLTPGVLIKRYFYNKSGKTL